MKKVALISLICIYALSSFGFGIRKFYCCGQLKSTRISLLPETAQIWDKGDDNSDCCKTKYHVFKVKDSHTVADQIDVPANYMAGVHITSAIYEIDFVTILPGNLSNAAHAPPLRSGVPIYVLNCVYRI